MDIRRKMESEMGGSPGTKLEPCGFMRKMISGLVDGTLRGVIAVYARFHVERCARCKSALAALRELRERLRMACAPTGSDTMDDDRSAGLSAEMDMIDARK